MLLVWQPHSTLLVRTEQKNEAHTRKAGRHQSSPACEKMIASELVIWLPWGFRRGAVPGDMSTIHVCIQSPSSQAWLWAATTLGSKTC